MSGDLFSAGGAGATEYGRPEQRPGSRMRAFVAGAVAVVKLLLYLATAALAAAAVSYYLLSIQLPRETAPLREEWALLRESIERRLGPEDNPGEDPGGISSGDPELPDALEPAQPGCEQPGQQPVGDTERTPPPEPGQVGLSEAVRERLLRALSLVAGQSHLAVAMGEAARNDLGTAAQTLGQTADLWEGTPGLEHLAIQARDCMAQLAVGDIRGTARLRLLWYESQKLFTDEIHGLETMRQTVR